jgi:hypothetical protein
MSVLAFHCDSCGARLTAPADRAGRKAKCRRCGSAVTVPSPAAGEDAPTLPAPPRAAPAPEPPHTIDDELDEDEEERPRLRKKAQSDWGKVSLGLLVLLVATVAGLVFGVMSCLGTFAFSFPPTAAADAGRALTSAMKWTVIHMIVQHATELAMLAGYALCCFVGPRHGGNRLAVAALVLGAVALVVNVGGDVVSLRMLHTTAAPESDVLRKMTEHPGKVTPEEMASELERQMQALQALNSYLRISQFLSQLQMLLRAAQYMTFAFFLMRLARSLGGAAVADRCLSLIKLSAAVVLLQLLNQACLRVMMRGSATSLAHMISIFSTGMMLLAWGQAGWFVVIVHEARGLVNARAGRRGR